MLVHWIWLAHRPGLSDWLRWQILQQYGDPEAVYFAGDYSAVEDLTEEGLQGLQDKDLRSSEAILEACMTCRISVLTIQDGLYCARLKNIPDPPLVLYYKGQVPDLDGTAVIGVVGTRQASLYGLSAAKRLGREIAAQGGIVVSGMAKGIDAQAMEGALEGGNTAVGVLGCGVDRIYPASNRSLFEDTKRYGCILSEFPPGTPPLALNFPRRNRIISGLSSGVLVVEAPSKSGALITARLAADQGRDVFVVPANIGVETCAGSNALLRDGAIAVSCGWDVLSEYEFLYGNRIRKKPELLTKKQKLSQSSPAEKKSGEIRKPHGESLENQPKKQENPAKSPIDKEENPPYIDINGILSTCSPQQQALLRTLQKGECLVDTLIEQTGLSTQEVLSGLTMLEIRGLICRLPGRRVSLKQPESSKWRK